MKEREFALPEIKVAVAIIKRHAVFLATQRPDGKPFGGYWELPGGKVETGESPEEALKRELAEELGIRAIKIAPFRFARHEYVNWGFTANLHFFNVVEFKGEPIPREGQNLRWVTPNDARELVFLPADAEILDAIASIS